MSKRSKKAKITAITIVPKEKPTKIKLVTDTSCQGLGKMSWEDVYNLIEKENPKFTEVKATVPNEEDSDSDSETPLKALAN